mgnify:CR=1 FL=1
MNAKVTTYTSRTQGFWQTHVVDTHAWWGVGAGQCLAGVTTSNSAGQDRVLGGFWASVSSKTDGKKRSASDKNRMILLQQLLAAILNNKAFGSVPTGAISITDATTTLCNPTATNRQINDAAGAMGMFNEGGDNGYYAHLSKADPALAQRLANKTYWNVVIH